MCAGGDARDSAEQDSAPFLGAFEELGPFLNAHPAGDFAHRGEERSLLRGRGAFRRQRR